MRQIDHLVYCVPNLNSAISYIHKLTGIRPQIGGKHLTKGTKNALLHLGGKRYLELLAVDEENLHFKSNRWMGIDLIGSEPKMTRWAITGEQISKDSKILQAYNSDMGIINAGSRETTAGSLLQWQMILPLSYPKIELMPFVVDWTNSESHPTESMEVACTLEKLEFEHPEPDSIQKLFEKLNIESNVLYGKEIKLTAYINSPKGLVKLN